MVLGKLRYKIRYETAAQKLHVTVVQCQNLPKKDILGAADPFVRVFLMTGIHAELKTKVVKKELNPTYNDEFSFVLSPTDVQKKTIVFQVFSANDGIGEVQVPLWSPSVDLALETDRWEQLEKITSDENKKPILKQKRPASMRSHSTASSVSTVRAVRATAPAVLNAMHDVGRSSVSSMQDVGRAASGNTSSSSSSSGNSTPARRPTTLSGNLYGSLHELNNRLVNYIQQIRLVPEENPTIITFERHAEGGSFDITSLPQYKEWESLQEEYLKQGEELARVETEVEMYKHKNQDVKDANGPIEKQIKETEASISAKRIRIQELEKKLRDIEMERQSLEKTRMTREADLAKLQSQIDFVPDGWLDSISQGKKNKIRAKINAEKKEFIARLSSLEWLETRTTQSFSTQEIHAKIKGDYDDRLKEELEKMRNLFSSQLSEVKLSIEKIYSLKIKELTGQRNEWNGKAKAEVDEILARLRNAKRQIIELEEQKLKLTQKERELGEKLEEDEASYKAMLAAKKKEIEFLEQEYNSLYMEYGKFDKEKTSFSYEVKRYNDLIKPAEKRVTRHAEQFIEDGGGKPDTSSSSSSSSSEDEEMKMRKGAKTWHAGML